MSTKQENHGTKKIFGVVLPDWVDEEVLKKLVYSFLSLVVAVLMSSLFVWPRFADLYSSEKELDKLEKSLEVLSSSMDEVTGFRISLGEDALGALEIAVPKSFDPGLILAGLRKVAGNAGVVLESYEVAGGVVELDVVDKSDTSDIKGDLVVLNGHKVNLKLVGKSDRLIRFINLLGNSSPLSVISELSLSEISRLFNEQGVSQLQMEVTYFESRLLGVDIERLVAFTEGNRQLLNDISLYSTPNLVQVGVSGLGGIRQGSIFGL